MVDKLKGLREVAHALYREALLAADPEEAVHRYFRLRGDVLLVGEVDYFLSQFRRIFVIGAGKASVSMARAVERTLGPRIEGGLVITSRNQAEPLKRVLVREAGHPFPDQDGIRATEEMIEFVSPLTDRDLVVCLISGGASALLAAPVEGISITDLQRTTKTLLQSGLSIREINLVRKRLSRIKGGKLARAVHPATIITLILSDVIGDQVDVIASGPTVPDTSGPREAMEVLQRKRAWEDLPESVRNLLWASVETEKTNEDQAEVFKKAHYQVIGSNRLSLLAAEQKAQKLKRHTLMLSSSVTGEAREIGKFYAAIAKEINESAKPVRTPACIVAGGETFVTVKGDGSGGRCQEMVLAAAEQIQEIPATVLLAAGTDGIDGPTDAAGAFVDSTTVERAARRGLLINDYLEKNDSYSFFHQLGDLVLTGPTGTNVMDVHILLVG